MRTILFTIVLAQACCTSLWFAGNAIITDLTTELQLEGPFLAHLTSAVQAGFIGGTFFFALFAIADRFSPSRVFALCSVLAAVFNLGIAIPQIGAGEVMLCRFATGFFLAGIYPVGMKIAADHFAAGLGRSLGFLVGALVVGTAFPHLLKSLSAGWSPWWVVYTTSVLSVAGGACIYFFVPDGLYRKKGQKMRLSSFLQGFRLPSFRRAAFGYFGHMWELYTFWAFVPLMIGYYNNLHPQGPLPVSVLSFIIIASGGVACVVGGLLSRRYGIQRIATTALSCSAICCIVSPFFLGISSPILLIAFLIFWAMVVVADSPLFSTLVAQAAPEEVRGSSLTIVNCIGFAITIISIQVINALSQVIDARYLFIWLAVGPIAGLWGLLRKSEVASPFNTDEVAATGS